VSHWMPKGAPVGDVRRVDEYTDYELGACLEHGARRVSDLPEDAPDRLRLEGWLAAMVEERAGREEQRKADAEAARKRLRAGRRR